MRGEGQCMEEGSYFWAVLGVLRMKTPHHHHHHQNSGVRSMRGQRRASTSAIFSLQSPNKKSTQKRDLFMLPKAALTLPLGSVTPPDGSQCGDTGGQPSPAEPPRATQETRKETTGWISLLPSLLPEISHFRCPSPAKPTQFCASPSPLSPLKGSVFPSTAFSLPWLYTERSLYYCW